MSEFFDIESIKMKPDRIERNRKIVPLPEEEHDECPISGRPVYTQVPHKRVIVDAEGTTKAISPRFAYLIPEEFLVHSDPIGETSPRYLEYVAQIEARRPQRPEPEPVPPKAAPPEDDLSPE